MSTRDDALPQSPRRRTERATGAATRFELAEMITDAVMLDLEDRQGILGDVEEETQGEMRDELVGVILRVLEANT